MTDRSGWWCNTCSEWVDGSCVTFDERHDYCGTPVAPRATLEANQCATCAEWDVRYGAPGTGWCCRAKHYELPDHFCAAWKERV